MSKVVNIVGSSSNVGKTYLLEGLIKELKIRGYSIATIKHDVHGFDIDKKGKDTYKHREAGSETVIISSKNRFAMIKELEEETELNDIIKMVKDKDIITNIELKTGVFEYEGIEKKVYDMIQEYGLKDKMIISSFNHFSILRMKEIDPTIKCGLLEESWLINAGAYVASVGVECYHPMYKNMTPEVVAEIRSHHLEINTWTVNEKEEIEEMFERGVDSVIGNYPDIVREIQKAYQ